MTVQLSVVKKDSIGTYLVVYQIVDNTCVIYSKSMYKLLLKEIKELDLKIIKSYEQKGYYKLTFTENDIEKLRFFIKLYKKRMNTSDTKNIHYYEF